jgi:hypothetical protein
MPSTSALISYFKTKFNKKYILFIVGFVSLFSLIIGITLISLNYEKQKKLSANANNSISNTSISINSTDLSNTNTSSSFSNSSTSSSSNSQLSILSSTTLSANNSTIEFINQDKFIKTINNQATRENDQEYVCGTKNSVTYTENTNNLQLPRSATVLDQKTIQENLNSDILNKLIQIFDEQSNEALINQYTTSDNFDINRLFTINCALASTGSKNLFSLGEEKGKYKSFAIVQDEKVDIKILVRQGNNFILLSHNSALPTGLYNIAKQRCINNTDNDLNQECYQKALLTEENLTIIGNKAHELRELFQTK